MRMYNKEKHAFIYIALEIIAIIPYLCVQHDMLAAVCCPHALDVPRKHFLFFSPVLLPLTSAAYHLL